MTLTLFTARHALLPELAVFAWGGPALHTL
jgi:hypothetical protein